MECKPRMNTNSHESMKLFLFPYIRVHSWLMDRHGQAQHCVLFETWRGKIVHFLGQAEARQPGEKNSIAALDLGRDIEAWCRNKGAPGLLLIEIRDQRSRDSGHR